MKKSIWIALKIAKVALLARGVVVIPAVCYIYHSESWPNVARTRPNAAEGQDPT